MGDNTRYYHFPDVLNDLGRCNELTRSEACALVESKDFDEQEEAVVRVTTNRDGFHTAKEIVNFDEFPTVSDVMQLRMDTWDCKDGTATAVVAQIFAGALASHLKLFTTVSE